MIGTRIPWDGSTYDQSVQLGVTHWVVGTIIIALIVVAYVTDPNRRKP